MDSKRLDEWQSDIEDGRVPAEIFADEEVFRLELDRVFARSWVFVALESEIPNPGDFVLRRLGRDEVIVVRDKTSAIRVLLNHCRHRGTAVCSEQRGNTTQFRCPYHGWVYDTQGAWIGAPFRSRAYGGEATADWGLLSAPHVAVQRGLVFASLDEHAPPLADALGAMGWYLDCAFGLHPAGMRLHCEPQRWRVRANWKTPAENFLCDAYHVATLHRSLENIGLVPDASAGVERQFHLDTENGHGAILSPRILPPPWTTWGYPPMVAKSFDTSALSEAQRRFLDEFVITTFTVYPNLSFIRVPGIPEPGLAPVVYTCLRQWQPVAPDEIEVWNFPLSWQAAPDWFNESAFKAGLAAFGPAGMFEQDDTCVWNGAPRLGASAFARARGRHLHYRMGADGKHYARRSDFVGPGVVTTSCLGDAPQRSFYRRWLSDLRTQSTVAQKARRLCVVEGGVRSQVGDGLR